MLAAIFSSYGNETRLDRFIPVSTASQKKSSSTVCACMQALRRSSVSNRSAIALRFFPALSVLLSSWSSYITVAKKFTNADKNLNIVNTSLVEINPFRCHIVRFRTIVTWSC